MLISEKFIDSDELDYFNREQFKPDVIVTWPQNCDYPVWRYFIRTHRKRFNKVIISFMNPHDENFDYREFVKGAMAEDNVTFLQAPEMSGEDWRNLSVNDALLHCESNWIWFTEMDFFVTSDKFWDEIHLQLMNGMHLIGIAQGGRLHPACIFAYRNLIERTRKDFGIVEGISDHFSKFQQDIEAMKDIRYVYLADENLYGYKHMNGLSHNWRLVTEGEKPVYRPDDFMDYLRFSLDLKQVIPIHPEFEDIAKQALKTVH